MISQLFILSPRGDVIINKQFRLDVPVKITTEVFFRTVKFWTDGDKAPAVFNEDGVNYVHVKVAGLFVAATTRKNVSPLLSPRTPTQGRESHQGLLRRPVRRCPAQEQHPRLRAHRRTTGPRIRANHRHRDAKTTRLQRARTRPRGPGQSGQLGHDPYEEVRVLQRIHGRV